MRKINHKKLIPKPGMDKPWSAIVGTKTVDDAELGHWGACAAISELVDGWMSDEMQDRKVMMDDVNMTIRTLEKWRDAFMVTVVARDRMEEVVKGFVRSANQGTLTAQFIRDRALDLVELDNLKAKQPIPSDVLKRMADAAFDEGEQS